VALTPKAIDTLTVLVEHSGSVVTKEELMSRVWPATFVGDGSLMRNVSALRKKLSECGDEYIDTIPRRGYRFKADVCVDSSGRVSRRSVVLLPLRLLGDAADETMARAVVDATAIKLSTIRECVVHSAGTLGENLSDDAVGVGRRLGVDYVLDGSFRVVERIGRVSVRLLSTADGGGVWSATLDEPCDARLTFEDTISSELAGALALILTNGERKLLVRRYTENAFAYQSYLAGRFESATRSQDGLERAIECFRRAIDADPSYAPAYSGLAASHALLPMIAAVPSGRSMTRAKAAAIHALDLDDTLIEARSALAFVAWHYDWNLRHAEREFRRMIRFAPGEPVVHVWYAMLLAELGRFDDALTEARRAQQLDPRSDAIRANVATVLHFCGRDIEALDEAAETLAANAGSVRAQLVFGMSCEQQGRTPDAVAAYELAATISRRKNPAIIGALGHARARNKDRDGAARALQDLETLDPVATSWSQALVWLGLDQHDRALALLRRACDTREFGVVTLGVDRRFEPMRRRSEFQELLRCIGLVGAAECLVPFS